MLSGLTIPEVLDLTSGQILEASLVIRQDNASHHIQRMDDETAFLRNKTAKYHCPLCLAPLTIRGAKDKQYHFKHPVDPEALCPYRSNYSMSAEEINACKYDGAKESEAHHRLKNWIEQSLRADKNVDSASIHREKRISGIKTTQNWKEWRQPDVQAKYKDQLFVFEIQLSTTFLSVIAGRREFYLKNGACLVWIFDHSMINSETMRFMERDIFFNNNRNLFFITSETVRNSLELKEFRLMCRYEKLVRIDFGIEADIVEEEVAISELTIDLEKQRIFYYDYDHTKKQLNDEIENRLSAYELDFEDEPEEGQTEFQIAMMHKRRVFAEDLLSSFGAQPPDVNTRQNFLNYWKIACNHKSRDRALEVIWEYYADVFAMKFNVFEREYSVLVRGIICALISLKEGKVYGSKLSNLKAVENQIFSGYKPFYRLFAFGVIAFGREDELQIRIPGSTCYKHVQDYKLNKADPRYAQNRRLDELVGFLFPEFT